MLCPALAQWPMLEAGRSFDMIFEVQWTQQVGAGNTQGLEQMLSISGARPSWTNVWIACLNCLKSNKVGKKVES